MNTIQTILSFWGAKLHDATEQQLDTFTTRIQEVKSKQRITVHYDGPLDRMVILAKSGEHTQRIGKWFDCDCHAFMCSGKGHENKQPCKHLYALALWVNQNLRAFGDKQ